MSDEVTTDTPPVAEVESPPVETPSVTPTPTFEDQMAAMEARLAEKYEQRLSQSEQLLRQYQEALGSVRQQAPKPADEDIAAQYKPEDRRFVQSEVKRAIDATIARLSLQGQIQQIIGNDAEITKIATAEYQRMKNDPAWQNQSEEVLFAMAAHAADAKVAKQRLETARKQPAKPPEIPPTSAPTFTQPPVANADKDVDEYMASQENQYAFQKLIGRNVNPLGEELVQFVPGGPKMKAKEAFRQMALRYTRIGIGAGPNLTAKLRGGA